MTAPLATDAWEFLLCVSAPNVEHTDVGCAEGGPDVPLLALKRATAKRGALLDAEVAGAIAGEVILFVCMPTGADEY